VAIYVEAVISKQFDEGIDNDCLPENYTSGSSGSPRGANRLHRSHPPRKREMNCFDWTLTFVGKILVPSAILSRMQGDAGVLKNPAEEIECLRVFLWR